MKYNKNKINHKMKLKKIYMPALGHHGGGSCYESI